MRVLRGKAARGAAACCLTLTSCAALVPRGAPRAVVRGPLPTRIQHPLALVSPHLGLRRAVAQPAGEFGLGVDLSYSSIFEAVDLHGQRVVFDGESARAVTRMRFGLGAGWDVESEVGALYADGGFLDEFVSAFHDFFGFPNQGRETVDDDDFDMSVRSQGRELYALQAHELHVEDLPLIFTYADEAPRAEAWSRAWRVGVELPTGSERGGAGNGEIDALLGICAERSIGRATHTLGLAWIDTHTPSAFRGSGIGLSKLVECEYACELRWSDVSSLVVQLDGLSALSDDIPYEEINSAIVDFGIGIVRDLGPQSRAYVSFHDDLLSKSGPDFSVACGWSWKL